MLFKGCRRCRRPRKGAAAAQGQIEGSSREYCNTLDFCQVGSKARGSSPFHNLGHQMIKEVAWRGKGSGGGPRASVPGGVGGRGTGPRDGANFATCVVFLSFLTRTKRRKMAFFEGCPVGWGGYPPELAWWTGGRPRALVAGGLGLGWLFQRGASPGKGWLAWQFQRRGQGLGGESKGFGSGRVGVLFFESWRVTS